MMSCVRDLPIDDVSELAPSGVGQIAPIEIIRVSGYI